MRRHVVQRPDRVDAGHLQRRRFVDRGDPGVRVSASNERHMQGAGEADIVDKPRLAFQECGIFEPREKVCLITPTDVMPYATTMQSVAIVANQ